MPVLGGDPGSERAPDAADQFSHDFFSSGGCRLIQLTMIRNITLLS